MGSGCPTADRPPPLGTPAAPGAVWSGDEDGDVAIFPLTADPKAALKDVAGELLPAYGEINAGSSISTTPTAANNVLYIASRHTLFAIADIRTAAQLSTNRRKVKR